MQSLAQPELYVEEKCTESKIPSDAGNPEWCEGGHGRIIKGK